jgi:hypothetical protein
MKGVENAVLVKFDFLVSRH